MWFGKKISFFNCDISDIKIIIGAQISKTTIAVNHLALGVHKSLITALMPVVYSG